MRTDEDFWTWVLMWAPLLCWIAGSAYPFLPLTAALIVTGIAVAIAVTLLRWRYRRDRRREADALRRRLEPQLERARWALITHLTEADERWLAERHFWVVPVQVAVLRAGLEADQGSREFQLPSPDQRRWREIRSRSEAARAAFEGIRRTEELVEVEPVEGELLPAVK